VQTRFWPSATARTERSGQRTASNLTQLRNTESAAPKPEELTARFDLAGATYQVNGQLPSWEKPNLSKGDC